MKIDIKQSDDWKGERHIRNVPLSGCWGVLPDINGAPRTKRRVKFCRVPDCRTPLDDSNYNGVCMSHPHNPDYCKCATCNGRKNKP